MVLKSVANCELNLYQAVISSNPAQITSAEQLVKANQLIAQVTNSDTGWVFCCQKIFKTSVLQAKFICFQVLVEVLQHRFSPISAFLSTIS